MNITDYLDPSLRVEPCDLFFTSAGTLLSQAIRFASWGWGQPYPKVSHVGGFAESYSARLADCVEALQTVQRHSFWDAYFGTDTDVRIFRPMNLTSGQRNTIVDTAEQMVGEEYGYGRLALHALDGLLLGAPVFRRLGSTRDKPICSWVWATAYKAAGLDFGIDAGLAQPDDMFDFCVNNPAKYMPLTRGAKRI